MTLTLLKCWVSFESRRGLARGLSRHTSRRRLIAPLSEAGVAKLAGGGTTDPAELYRVTGGNPFFVTEVLAHPSDTIPRTVQEAINGRLARLGKPARGVAEAVAVISPPVSLPLLTAVMPQVAAGLEQCLTAGVLHIEHAVVEFRHELARMAVLEAMPAHRWVILHGRILRALRTAPYGADDLARGPTTPSRPGTRPRCSSTRRRPPRTRRRSGRTARRPRSTLAPSATPTRYRPRSGRPCWRGWP
jgi:hypothetical protein